MEATKITFDHPSPRCDRCAFYQARSTSAGDCRVNPPVVATGEYWGFFPTVRPTTWCGAFHAIDDE